MSVFCQFSSLTSSIYWQIQYKTKKLKTNIFWKPYVQFPSNKNYIDQCTKSDMMNLSKWFYSQFLFSWNIVSNLLKACTRWLKKIKQTNKQTKRQKKRKKQQNKNKKGPVPLTYGRLHYFSPCNNPPLSKWLRLKWQVAQSFHQPRSPAWFILKGCGAPTKTVDLLD